MGLIEQMMIVKKNLPNSTSSSSRARHETLVSPRAIQNRHETSERCCALHFVSISVSDISYCNRKRYCYPNPPGGAFHLNVPTALRWVAVETGRGLKL